MPVTGEVNAELAIGACVGDGGIENLGCEQSVVGLVIPTGYSFNLGRATAELAMSHV
jgi:Na+/H+-dicarboxylate symporter